MPTLGDTAELAILLKLKDEFTGPLGKAESQLGHFNAKSATVAGGMSKIGAGLATGLKTTIALGAAAFGVLAGIEAQGLRSLEEAQTLNAQTAAALKSTGAAAGVSAAQIVNWSKSLSDANAVDELAIQHVENLLLTFRAIKGDTFPQATQAVLDISRALGTDAASSAIQLGKALDNPTLGLTALRRVGVSFSAVQVEQIKGFMKTNDVLSAQKIILAEINKEFGGSGSAFSETTAGKLAKVKDKWEELTRTMTLASLPAVTALADGMNQLLSSPEAIAGAKDLGTAIAGIFSPANIKGGIEFAKEILPPIEAGLSTTLKLAKGAFDIFNGLPPELKTAAVAALVGNKLTGGLVASGVGEIGKALLGGGGLLGRGASAANPLWVQSVGGLGTKDVPGPGQNVPSQGTGDIWTGIKGVISKALTITTVAAIAGVAIDQYTQISSQGDAMSAHAADWAKTASLTDLMNGQAAVLTGMKQLADQSGYNPLAAAGTGGLNETLRIINAAIAERQQPGINAFRTGERADPNLAEAAYNNYRQGERGTIASRSMSGQISTALKGAKLGPSAAEMGHSLRSAFSESAAPSFKSMTSAMGQLRMLQARYLAQGDTKLAASIKGEIAQLVAAIHGTTAAVMGIQMGGNIYNVTSGTGVTRTASTGTTPKKGALYEGGGTLHVNVQVSAQQNIHANTMQHRWGLTPTEAGAR